MKKNKKKINFMRCFEPIYFYIAGKSTLLVSTDLPRIQGIVDNAFSLQSQKRRSMGKEKERGKEGGSNPYKIDQDFKFPTLIPLYYLQ